MYDEQIENLINLALADGELTEKEKQILFKKAEAEGIDLVEFQMVLDAKLYERKQAQAKTAAPPVTASNQQQFSINETNINTIDDKPGIGWQILAIVFPIAGLIMYFNNKKEFPNKASRYGTLAGIGFVIGLIMNLS